jgi:hypothetical protein
MPSACRQRFDDAARDGRAPPIAPPADWPGAWRRTKKLARGRLAAPDVVATPALPRDYPLLGLSNVVLSPSVADGTPMALRRALAMAIEHARQPLLHRVA